MNKTIPFKKEHLEVMDIRDHEDRLLRDQNTVQCLEGSIALTAIRDGRVAACYGIAPYLGDLADIWLIPSNGIDEHTVELAKGARRFLEEMREDLGIRRMETLCIDDVFHARWMVFLGFQREGVKEKYIGETDYSMWGRIWE